MLPNHAFYINRLSGETKKRVHSNHESVKVFCFSKLISLIKNLFDLLTKTIDYKPAKQFSLCIHLYGIFQMDRMGIHE